MRARTWAVVACAGLIGGAVVAQPPKAEPGKRTTPATAPKTGNTLMTMIADARGALAKTRDYTCTFTRQEAHNGALSAEQVGE